MNRSDVISYYTADGADYINSYLRGEELGEDDESYFRSKIEELDNKFIPSDSDMVIYRGITHDFDGRVDPAYLSCSKLYCIAEEFSCGKTILEIRVKKGAKILDTSPYHTTNKNEEEVILPRGSYLKVVERDGRKIICTYE